MTTALSKKKSTKARKKIVADLRARFKKAAKTLNKDAVELHENSIQSKLFGIYETDASLTLGDFVEMLVTLQRVTFGVVDDDFYLALSRLRWDIERTLFGEHASKIEA